MEIISTMFSDLITGITVHQVYTPFSAPGYQIPARSLIPMVNGSLFGRRHMKPELPLMAQICWSL